MSTNNKWGIETTIKFIQLYKLHPCLWQFQSPDYKIKHKRDAAYNSIVQEMNITGFGNLEVKNKIKNLRSTYQQENKKIQDSKKSGAGLSNVYISNIKWLKEMEEVFSKDLKRNVYENINQTNNEAAESQASSFAVPTCNSTSVTVSSHETPTNEEAPPATATISSVGNTPRAKKRTRDTIVKAISDLKKINDDVNSEVETVWDAFGKSVAMQLKMMSVENALLAQCQLQNILTEFGLKDHREKTASGSAMSNYSDRRPSSVLSDNTDISYVNSPNIYLEESVTSPLQASSAPTPGQIIFATPPTIETSTTQNIIYTSSAAMDSSPAQIIYTTQPAMEPILTTSLSATQHSNYNDDNIITAAMNAASAVQSIF